MSDREYSQTEQRRTEGTASRRYQHGGRSERWDRQSGRRSEGGGRTGSTGGFSDQQSSQQFSGGFDETSRGTGQQTGGQTGYQSSGQTGQTGQTGQYGGGQTSQFSGGQTSGGQMGQQTGSQRGSGQMGGSQMTTGGTTGGQMSGGGTSGGRMGGSQMSSGGTSQSSGSVGGQMGGQQTGGSQMGQQVGQTGGQSGQRGLIRPVTVSDVAATEVVTVQPDAPIPEVVGKLSRENVGSVVVTEGSRPIGILTDRKIALALGETQDVSQLRAADVMSEDLVTVPEGTNVFDLVRRLSDKGVRRVPVVDDRGDLKGIVSLDDVVVLLAEEFYNASEIIRKQSPRF